MAIIFADDDDFVRDVAESLLSSLTDDVILCENGAEAVEKVVSKGAGVKLIILDLNMPQMDGYAAAKKIRSQGIKANMLAFSADNDGATQSKVKDAGFTGLIHKPLDLGEVKKYYN